MKIPIIRTFNAWYYEFKQICENIKNNFQYYEVIDWKLLFNLKLSITKSQAKMYYNVGYSPKMVFNEINLIPVGWDVL